MASISDHYNWVFSLADVSAITASFPTVFLFSNGIELPRDKAIIPQL
jgi:hypothetical protein